MSIISPAISIVTPTFRRPVEIQGLLENIARQNVLPFEIIIVDGASEPERETEKLVDGLIGSYPFAIRYLRHDGGTAIQRNVGIENAGGDFIALIDDDVRLEPDFLEKIYRVFSGDEQKKVGGVVGYRTNQHFRSEDSQRWRWYKRLKLLTTYEPGRYDFKTGYPINNNMQPPFTGTRPVDFMTTACAVWRKEVFASGMRFDHFFRDYGVLEDAHFSLRAGRRWKLLQAGDAHCEEMRSPNGRVDRKAVGYKSVVNYYFVFNYIAGPLSRSHKLRFWRYQAFEFFRIASSAIRRWNWDDVSDLRGRIDAVRSILRGDAFDVAEIKPDFSQRTLSAE